MELEYPTPSEFRARLKRRSICGRSRMELPSPPLSWIMCEFLDAAFNWIRTATLLLVHKTHRVDIINHRGSHRSRCWPVRSHTQRRR